MCEKYQVTPTLTHTQMTKFSLFLREMISLALLACAMRRPRSLRMRRRRGSHSQLVQAVLILLPCQFYGLPLVPALTTNYVSGKEIVKMACSVFYSVR